jgi:hypothetical protein
MTAFCAFRPDASSSLHGSDRPVPQTTSEAAPEGALSLRGRPVGAENRISVGRQWGSGTASRASPTEPVAEKQPSQPWSTQAAASTSILLAGMAKDIRPHHLHRQPLEIRRKIPEQISEIAATHLFSVVHGFERVERNRLFLAAHRQRTKRATLHAEGKRADALNKRR